MLAAVVHHVHGIPSVEEFPDPVGSAEVERITVTSGTIGPTELMRVSNAASAYYGVFNGPKIVGGEGIGHLDSGQRVYFGHSAAPYGAWGQRTVVPTAEVWPIDDDLDDSDILPLGISGTGALIPLEEARIAKGEKVLILGATGPLGQIAVQLARIMGAGNVVAAARNTVGLARLAEMNIADTLVPIGGEDDTAALRDAAGGSGFDVVLDIVYGAPLVTAIKATARGARIMSIGNQAGKAAAVELQDLIFRTHAGVATGARPAVERKAAFERLVALARTDGLRARTTQYTLAQAPEAWAAQGAGPHAKIILRP